MNAMKQDLHDLGLRLWPDDTPLRPRRSPGDHASSRLRSRVAATAVGTVVFVLVFGAIALSIILSHSATKPPPVATKPTADGVVRVEVLVPVPGSPLTFVVARGATLALHLHFDAPTPASNWASVRTRMQISMRSRFRIQARTPRRRSPTSTWPSSFRIPGRHRSRSWSPCRARTTGHALRRHLRTSRSTLSCRRSAPRPSPGS